MKKFIIFLFLIVFIIPVQSKGKTTQPQKSPRIEKIINSQWTFNYFPGETKEAIYENLNFDDSKWPLISIPHTWNTFETTGEIHPFIKYPSERDNPYWWNGWGWYRKRFRIDADITNQKVFVEFEGVQKYCKVWINGIYLGDHKGGFGSFDFDITGQLLKERDNILVVAVSNRQKDEFSIPPMAAANFNVYGGLSDNVKLVIKNKLYIPMQGSASHEGGTYITTPSVSEKQGIVRVQTWVQNDYPQVKNCVLNTYIIDASKKVVQVIKTKAAINPKQLYKFDQTFKPVKNPQLWSPESPYLYKVVSEVTDGSKATDTYASPLGFRWFWWNFNENLLYINGKSTVIRGAERHREFPWLGTALPSWISEEDISQLADKHKYNFLRIPGCPADETVYELCDRSGIITSVESPSIGNQPFSAEVQKQQMTESVRRFRNHPGVMFWGLGSNTDHPVKPEYALAEDTTRILTGNRLSYAAAQAVRIHSFENLAAGSSIQKVSPYLKGTGTVSGGETAGAPAKIALTVSSSRITAALSSVVIVTALITDSKGNPVPGATNSLRWSVSGPATLAGPALTEYNLIRNSDQGVLQGKNMPVPNVIRSAGKPGRIRVTASSGGLASGSAEIDAEAAKPVSHPVIEPQIDESGRIPVAKQFFTVSRLDDTPQEIKRSSEDVTFRPSDSKGYRLAVRDHIIRNNPSVDTSTVEFRALTGLFATYLANNNGLLPAEDYNFNVDHYNTGRQIAGYINATKLPPLYKEALRGYYTNELITKGNEKNAGDEMNWLNWIPSGGTVVVSQNGNSPSWPKGTIITDKTALYDLIVAVYPVFARYSDDAKQRALTFISKMNPYIVAVEVTEGDNKKMYYTAIEGKPVLIPLIKFISE